jgi:hypothetical protein
MTRWAVAAGPILAMAVAIGCVGPSTQISSNRAPEFTTKLSELFVISQAGMDGELDGRHFEDKLVATGTKCGLRLGVTGMTGLELDPAIHTQRMKAFGARHVLVLRLTGGTKNSGGGIVAAQYDGRLYDADKLGRESASMLWRADVRLRPGEGVFGDSGEQLAVDLLRQLKNDRLIAPCVELADPLPLPERGATYAR